MLSRRVKNTIQKYHLIDTNDCIVIGVSGGPDSMCLLHVLCSLQQDLQIKKIVVAHVNHMIREEAEEETNYVREYCSRIGIECFVTYEPVEQKAKQEKIGVEEAGRNARYAFFEKVAKEVGANKIATAHHLQDNAETVLLHLIRGSGLSGLQGIKPCREGRYIKPLLECTRQEIEEYCNINQLNPRYDKSNEDCIYTRNRIRHELIPILQKDFNPNIIETLNRLAKIVEEEEEYMTKVTTDAYDRIVLEEKKDEIVLDLKLFNQEQAVIKSRIVIYTASKILSYKSLETVHIQDVLMLCDRNIGNKYLMPNKQLKVLVNDKKIFFIKFR